MKYLSRDEYIKGVMALYENTHFIPTPEEEHFIMEAELNLKIDHKLGIDFPLFRRKVLWKTAQHVEKRRLWWTILGLSFMVFKMRREYSKVLSPTELEKFLGDNVS